MSERTLTIVFRGLMVFHQSASQKSLFEVGLLSPHNHQNSRHISRINTYRNGVLDEVLLLKGVNPNERVWRLNIEGPIDGVSTEIPGTFQRIPDDNPIDYRWLIDLENNTEFYGPLTGLINTDLLNPVLHIPSGKFYTRLQSRVMQRQKDNGQPTDFGMVAAAIGCDIRLEGRKAELVGADTGASIFTFEADSPVNTLYEIANTPSDTHMPLPNEDHFQHYYEMLPANIHKFKFHPKTPPLTKPRGPSPALCGAVSLGQMKKDL